MLTPFSRSALADPELCTCRDAFNYFHSSHQVHIVQNFCILVARWGIPWRPLAVSFERSAVVFAAFMQLHHFRIVEDFDSPVLTGPECLESKAAFERWWSIATALREDSRQGSRIDPETCNIRDTLPSRSFVVGAMHSARRSEAMTVITALEAIDRMNRLVANMN